MFRGKNQLSLPEDTVDERLSHGKTRDVLTILWKNRGCPQFCKCDISGSSLEPFKCIDLVFPFLSQFFGDLEMEHEFIIYYKELTSFFSSYIWLNALGFLIINVIVIFSLCLLDLLQILFLHAGVIL